MNTFQKNALFLALIVFVLVGTLVAGYYGYQSHARSLEEQRLAWKKENIRQLKDLSQIGVLSTEEQNRLDNAGDDVDKLQQVLLDLHTERHTLWTAHAKDVAEREQTLRRVSGSDSYAFEGQYREAEEELAKERAEVQENLDAYERGYRSIRAWRPIPFDQFQSQAQSGLNRTDGSPQTPPEKPTAIVNASTARVGGEPQLGPAAESEPAPDPVQTVPSPAQNALDGVDVGVTQSLRIWAQAMLSNDPQQVANCYAVHVDRYFLKLDVDNAAVREYMTEWGQNGTKRITGFSTRDITFENESATTAKVRLVKDLTITDSAGTTERLIRSRLYLGKEDGVWKITSEQDFK